MHAEYLLLCIYQKVKEMPTETSKKDIKKAPSYDGAGGDEWIRTTDSRIFSPMLYQLSYITLL